MGWVAVLVAQLDAITKCRTADGRLLFVDILPPGCVVEGLYKNQAPNGELIGGEPPTGRQAPSTLPSESELNAFNTRASIERRRIESAAEDAAEAVQGIRDEIAGIPSSVPGRFRNSASGVIGYMEAQRKRDQYVDELRMKEAALLAAIERLRLEFKQLTGEVAKGNGGATPSSWSTVFRCRSCP